MTGLERNAAKAVNFAKIYGAGVRKFAAMIGKPLAEAQRHLSSNTIANCRSCTSSATSTSERARAQGYIELYDGARRHCDRFDARRQLGEGRRPVFARGSRAAASRIPSIPGIGRGRCYRADTHTAMNALIQGSAARHTKLWMRACWREGIVPLLQMHDCLDCSVSSREQAELVARLGCEAVQLEVPMRVDLKFGRSWGDAKHTWDELHRSKPPRPKARRSPAPTRRRKSTGTADARSPSIAAER